MNLVMIGTGYVGLVSGTCFAEIGHNVICVDKDNSKITSLKNNIMPIFEKDLGEMVTRNVAAKRLSFSNALQESISNADAIFIAVGTPDNEDGSVNLDYIFAATEEIARYVSKPTLVVVKSTVPVGTCKKIQAILDSSIRGFRCLVASNPEFLREGNAVFDFMNPDRIVAGLSDDSSKPALEEIYKPLTDKGFPLLLTNLESSELIKYASNAFLATKIAFINQIADLSEAAGANVSVVAHGMGLDKRIGKDFLKTGPGYGGSCFPKDTLGLVDIGRIFSAPQTIVEHVIKSNNQRFKDVAAKIHSMIGESTGKIAVLGTAFKADTDDARESPAIAVIEELIKFGYKNLHLADPEAIENTKTLLKNYEFLSYYKDSKKAVEDADYIIILTEWAEFKSLAAFVKDSKTKAHIMDFRGIIDKNHFTQAGHKVYVVGNQ